MRTLLRAVPSGKIEIVWNGSFTRIEMNCSCLDALPICKGMCCRWKSGYVVELEADEVEKYKSIPHPMKQGVRILAPDAERKWCTYFNSETGKCGIHNTRPKMCRQWHCSPAGEQDDVQIEVRDAGWLLTPLRKFEMEIVK